MTEISIITPVFEDPRVEHALESIRAQRDVSGVETIVVDGGSTGETRQVLGAHDDLINTLISEPDDGVYDAMNKGIDRASGDIIGILNADDRYQDPTVLRRVLDSLSASGASLCYGDLVYVDDAESVVRYWKSGAYNPNRFYFGWMPPHPTVFVRQTVYDRYGTFDLNYRIAADYEFLLRVLLAGDVSATYVDDVLVRMATGGQSNASVRNIFDANIEVYRAWRKHDLRGGLHVPVVKPLRKFSQYLRAAVVSRS